MGAHVTCTWPRRQGGGGLDGETALTLLVCANGLVTTYLRQEARHLYDRWWSSDLQQNFLFFILWHFICVLGVYDGKEGVSRG